MKSDASENVHLDWKGKTMSKDFNDFMNTQDDSMLYDTQDVQNNKIWAALSYVGILFILPLLVTAGSPAMPSTTPIRALSCSLRKLWLSLPMRFWGRFRCWAEFSLPCFLWQFWL